jgi:hypothetical protein
MIHFLVEAEIQAWIDTGKFQSYNLRISALISSAGHHALECDAPKIIPLRFRRDFVEVIDGRTDQAEDPNAFGSAPDHDDCHTKAGWLAASDDSQKAANLARDDRMSLTIDHDTPQVMEITGLSMAGYAQVVNDPAEAEKALRLLMLKYPQQDSIPLPMPTPADVRIFRVTPKVISVLDYTKGFGHTDLVTC